MRRLLWRTTALLLAGAGLAVVRAADDKSAVRDADVVTWVDRLVKEGQPAAEDRRFDEIGWAWDIREAERLAKDNRRPVFLFTHDGHMNVGRC
jgi:hypothetical protein